MERMKRKWGDRKDGIWLKDLPALNRIMPGIMPNRADNEAYINVEVDLRPLDDYLAHKNAGRTEDKYTYFHVISAAIAKAFILRPRMNRFICNKRIYQHRDLTLAFVVKKQFSDKSEEGLAFLHIDDTQTMDSYHDKIMSVIHDNRRADVKDTSTGAMSVLHKLPHWVLNRAVSATL